MPRNNRRSFYTRKFDLRFNNNMAGRLETLAVHRKASVAHIVRLAIARSLQEMEKGVTQEEGMTLLEGQPARISGLQTQHTTPDQKFLGTISAVVKDEVSGWTYATFTGDGPFTVIVIKLDGDGKLQGNYNLEVEDENEKGPVWRKINGTRT